jgi:hypothetical protein
MLIYFVFVEIMSNFVLEIFDDESPKCQFYTVRLDGDELSETDKFLDKFNRDEHLKPYVQQLVSFIFDTIGIRNGAINDFFREERKAQALPPPVNVKVEEIDFGLDFPLRLYCLRLSDSCVILFNGGEKTSQRAEDGKTSMAFYEANQYAEKILNLFNSKIIRLNSEQREIVDFYTSEPYNELI